jgi:inner membrane protein
LEPITHFLTGACLARAGFNRKTALATATMTLAAEAPDLDVFSSFKGPVYGFAHHRGFTHSFLGLFLVSAVVVGFVYLLWILRGRKTNIPDLPLRWGLLFVFAYVAGLSHILLDFTNNYGVRPFWPFFEKWYSWDVSFILEPPLFLFLIAGLLLPLFFSRGKPAPRGSTAARLALLCVIALWAVRWQEMYRIERALKQQHFDSETPLRVSAYPYWTHAPRWLIAMRWSAVVETSKSFITSDVNPSTGVLDPAALTVLPKPPETPATLAAKRSYLGRVYLDWARYPLITESSEGQDSIVYFQDLRFGYRGLRRNSILSASVKLDSNLRVVGEAMGPRTQNPPLD